MASIRARTNNQKLFFDFKYLGRRCREYTKLVDTPANRSKLQKVLDKIQAEITLGMFDYIELFYNPVRHHGNNNGLSPMKFENKYYEELSAV